MVKPIPTPHDDDDTGSPIVDADPADPAAMPNPFWDAYKAAFPHYQTDEELYATRRRRTNAQLDEIVAMMAARFDMVPRAAWALPDPDALAYVARQLAPRAVEMGAGAGYWAWQMRLRGVDMLAYDMTPPQSGRYNPFLTRFERDKKSGRDRPIYEAYASYTLVEEARPAILAAHADRTLFLCWPPYKEPMAHGALRTYGDAGGRKVVYIGEPEGGACADNDFFVLLESAWEEVDDHPIAQWPGIHDHIYVYERLGLPTPLLA